MSEILCSFKQKNVRFLILDCGHWFKWTGKYTKALADGEEFRCPNDEPITVVLPSAPHATGEAMSIDATILDVQRDGADVVLTLGNRIDDGDTQSIAGQPKLRILNATWEPEPGMDIWGGSSSVQIITKRGERDPATNNAIGPWYRREGYTRLVEAPPSAPTPGEEKA